MLLDSSHSRPRYTKLIGSADALALAEYAVPIESDKTTSVVAEKFNALPTMFMFDSFV